MLYGSDEARIISRGRVVRAPVAVIFDCATVFKNDLFIQFKLMLALT